MNVRHFYIKFGYRILVFDAPRSISSPSDDIKDRFEDDEDMTAKMTEALRHLEGFHEQQGGQPGALYWSDGDRIDGAVAGDVDANPGFDGYYLFVKVADASGEWYVARGCDQAYSNAGGGDIRCYFNDTPDLTETTPDGETVRNGTEAAAAFTNHASLPAFGVLMFPNKDAVDAANGSLADFGG